MSSRLSAKTTTRVSDILIDRLFQVECAEHGVIDQVRTYADAIAARRDHYFDVHKAGEKA